MCEFKVAQIPSSMAVERNFEHSKLKPSTVVLFQLRQTFFQSNLIQIILHLPSILLPHPVALQHRGEGQPGTSQDP